MLEEYQKKGRIYYPNNHLNKKKEFIIVKQIIWLKKDYGKENGIERGRCVMERKFTS